MKSPVIAIPPSYSKGGDLDVEQTVLYCNYLISNGGKRIMTTAGTSHFNLLSVEEVHAMNTALSGLKCEKILGVPALSLRHAIDFIEYANENYNLENTKLLLLYPDRFYSYENTVSYFEECAKVSKFQCYVHGKSIRVAKGGTFDFDAKIIRQLFDAGICGIKEEHSNLQKSFNVINKIRDLDFEVIVAGGSMRRFLFLENAGADTFLSGVGNLVPEIENDFVRHVNSGSRDLVNEIVKSFETPCFEVFMKIGWHAALMHSIREMDLGCFYSRKPFPELSNGEVEGIIGVNNLLRSYNER